MRQTGFWFLAICLVLVNLAAFACFGLDKRRAIRHQWRIPEAVLLLLTWAGGALGAFLGMKIFRHKTRKLRFQVQVPLALVLWALGLAYLWKRGIL